VAGVRRGGVRSTLAGRSGRGGADLPVDLATDAGVAADEVRSALDDDALREDVRQRFTEARRRGATGVPTFASDGHAARGAVPPERLRRPVEGV
jgi:predicted DsbA family dithiol-disulfide isomerase